MEEHAMLDVSMVAHRIPLARMLAMARENPEALSGLAISDALVRLLRGYTERPDSDFVTGLIHKHFRVPRGMIDLASMREFIEITVERQFVTPYRRESFSEIPPAYRALIDATGNEWVTQIVFEEWEYLMNHSWLFSKTRAVYDHIVDAGGNALYLTKKKLENAVHVTQTAAKDTGGALLKASDFVVGKTIKKPPNENISPNDRVRALAKWVVVGGSAATGLMVPMLGVAVSAATSMFLLYDP